MGLLCVFDASMLNGEYGFVDELWIASSHATNVFWDKYNRLKYLVDITTESKIVWIGFFFRLSRIIFKQSKLRLFFVHTYIKTSNFCSKYAHSLKLSMWCCKFGSISDQKSSNPFFFDTSPIISAKHCNWSTNDRESCAFFWNESDLKLSSMMQ